MVLHHGIGLEHIAADLATPFDPLHLPFDLGHLLLPFPLLELDELALKHTHGHLFVLELAALILALDHNARRQVGQADGGAGLVHVLAACAAGPIGIHPHLVHVDLHVVGILVEDGGHIQGGEGGMPPAGGIEGGHAHQPVHALFRLQVAVGAIPLDLEGDVFDARLFPVQVIQFLDRITFLFAVAAIHPVQQGHPVLGLRAPRPRVKGQHRVAAVIGAF